MGTSPLSPDEIRAAAGAHHQLGPEYSDAVVASFLEKVDQEIAARVEERFAATSRRARPARPVEPKEPREPESRRTLVKGFALGVAASLLTLLLFAGFRPGHHAILLLFPLALAFGAGALWTSRRASRRAALRQSSPGAVSGGFRRLT